MFTSQIIDANNRYSWNRYYVTINALSLGQYLFIKNIKNFVIIGYIIYVLENVKVILGVSIYSNN